MPLTLPSKPNVPSDKLTDYTILIAGPKKIGKTSFCACAHNAFILEGEPGNAAALPIRQQDITNWMELIEITNLLVKNPTYCDIRVLDDVPSFYSMCMDYCCQKHGFEYPSDAEWGKGWKIVDSEFQKRLKFLQALKGGTIYTAHTQIREVKNRNGTKFNKLETSMTGQADKVMDALVQIWGTMEYDKDGKRIITIRGDDYIKAGCGLPNRFRYTDGSEVKQIPLGNNPQEGWNNFEKGFNNQLVNTSTLSKVQVTVSIPAKKPGLTLKKG